MEMNKQKGNMYGFVTHTWNPIKGVCPHQCSYCYMRRFWPRMGEPDLELSEFRTNLGTGNFIFIGSSIDLWAESIPFKWQEAVLDYLKEYPENKYLFQTKNPKGFENHKFTDNQILCITLESNISYIRKCPAPFIRVNDFAKIDHPHKMITIEPVLDFDPTIMLSMIDEIKPEQINIGANTSSHKFPEPSRMNIKNLINCLNGKGYNVHLKDNLKRLTE